MPQITPNNIQRNVNYDRVSGFSPNGYKSYPTSFAGNNSQFDRRDLNIPVHLGANRAYDNNGPNIKERNYNSRPNGNGYMQNDVYHRNNNVNTPYRGVDESRQPQNGDSGAQRENSGNANDAIRKVRMVANASRTTQGRSDEINMEPDGELTSIDPKDLLIEDNYPEKNEKFRSIKEYDQIEEKYCITDDVIEKKVAKCELLEGEEILGRFKKI